MKKNLYWILALLVILLLAACGQEQPQDTTVAPTGDSTVDTTHSALEDNDVFDSNTMPVIPYDPSQATEGSDTTDPEETTDVPADTTEATTPDNTPAPSTPVADPDQMDYQKFHALDGKAQQTFVESFEDLDAFFEWYNKARETYEKENPPIEIGGNGVIDMEELLGGNG